MDRGHQQSGHDYAAVHPRRDQDQDWDPSRCNRFLRPLSSKIASIRKEKEFERVWRDGAANSTDLSFEPKSTFVAGTNRSPQNHAWETLRMQKLKRKYGQRYRRANEESAERANAYGPHQAGLLDVSTPFLKRIQGYEGSSTESDLPVEHTDARVPCKPYKRREREPLQLGSSAGLTSALDTLLSATQPYQTRSHSGALSLVDTCLKAMPNHIKEETTYRKSLNPDDKSDVTTETFNVLAECDTTGRWLPSLVRWQAASMLGECFAGQVFSIGADAAVNRVIGNHDALDVFEDAVLFAVGSLPQLPAPETLEQKLSSLSAFSQYSSLDKVLHDPSRDGLVFRLFRTLFENKTLPSCWAATSSFSLMWTRILKSLASMDEHCASAASLIEAIMVASITSMMDETDDGKKAASDGHIESPSDIRANPVVDSALTDCISSLCSLLISFELNDQNDATCATLAGCIIRGVSARCIQLYGKYKIRRRLRNSQQLVRAILVLGADCTLGHSHKDTRSALEKLDKVELLGILSGGGDDAANSIPQVSRMIASACRYGEKATAGTGMRLLDRALSHLVASVPSSHNAAQQLLRRIKLDSAMLFAHTSGGSDATAFALHLEDLIRKQELLEGNCVHRLGLPSASFKGSDSQQHYRWVDGLSEWIPSTPAAGARSARIETRSMRSRIKKRHRSADAETALVERNQNRNSLPASTRSPDAKRSRSHKIAIAPSDYGSEDELSMID